MSGKKSTQLKLNDELDTSLSLPLNKIEREIIIEAKKIANNEVSSAYMLVQKATELIKLERQMREA